MVGREGDGPTGALKKIPIVLIYSKSTCEKKKNQHVKEWENEAGFLPHLTHHYGYVRP